jgi:hypothetical protein
MPEVAGVGHEKEIKIFILNSYIDVIIMKISIKELKIEEDGSEMFFVRDVGVIIPSKTFSGETKKCCQEKHGKGKEETEETIDFEALAPVIAYFISKIKSSEKEEKEKPAEKGSEASPAAQ